MTWVRDGPALGDAVDDHGRHDEGAVLLVEAGRFLDLGHLLPGRHLKPEQRLDRLLLLVRGIEEVDPEHVGGDGERGVLMRQAHEAALAQAMEVHHRMVLRRERLAARGLPAAWRGGRGCR